MATASSFVSRFSKTRKYSHRDEVLHVGEVEDDLGVAVLLGGLAQVALEAGPGEAGGDTAQEEQDGTVHDLLWEPVPPLRPPMLRELLGP